MLPETANETVFLRKPPILRPHLCDHQADGGTEKTMACPISRSGHVHGYLLVVIGGIEWITFAST